MRALIYILIFLFSIELSIADIFWANQVLGFSSQVASKQFSSNQILGEPSVMPDYGVSASAWSPLSSQKNEWIRIKFPKKIIIKEIGIFENVNPGAIVKVTIYDSLGNGYNVFTNINPEPKLGNGEYFRVNPDKDFTCDEIKIEINLVNYFESYQIDAVYISDSVSNYNHNIKLAANSEEFFSKPQNLSNNINSLYPELAPVISQDGETLYFTRDSHPQNTGPYKKQDIWYSVKDSLGEFELAKKLPPPLNNIFANFLISVTTDGNRLLLGNIYLDDGTQKPGLSFTKKQGNGWSYPDSIHIENYYNLSSYGSYSLTSNGRYLLFAIEREDSYGSNDLYISEIQFDRTWSEPINLGSSINTASEEATPFLSADNTTLYFSTAGRPGYGRNDIFVSRRLDDSWTNWSEPHNLGDLINSSGWDAYFTIPASGDFAYFVSNENSYGAEDIFRIELPRKASPKGVILITGKVLNAKTNQPIEAEIIYETLPDGKRIGIANSNENSGTYQIALPIGQMYGFLAQADNFVSVNENIDLSSEINFAKIERNLYLVPIEKGQRITLNNIFFNFGEYELLTASFSELNRIVNLLENNENLVIKINGHTDNVGSIEENQVLSEKRANAVKTYLISKGISQNRLQTQGYGKSKPITNNESEEARRRNRRVEFEIIEN